MIDNNQNLDIVQRIAEALARTSEPKICIGYDFKPEEGTIIGEVPRHLRHVCNLLEELAEEALAAERHDLEVRKQYFYLYNVFFAALIQNVPCDEDIYKGIKVCADWQVIGLSHNKSGEERDRLH